MTATVNDLNYEGSASETFTIKKAPASVLLSNMTQIYTGSALTPTATTTPAGLTIVWTNVPQTNAGSYSVTATVNDLNYEGSASETFTIKKAPASVLLSYMTQIYTGSALTPTATTTPAGLTIVWTNVPQTNAGSYSVTATVNDLNYEGSASEIFTIKKAPSMTTVTCEAAPFTYNGSAHTPCSASVTGPALSQSLTVSYTNNVNAGTATASASYDETANYFGSSGSKNFTIKKAPASVLLSYMTQIYTGSALTPTATTTPAGLTIVWTNAPQTNAGSYSVTATVNDLNYEGSASGTFTISAWTLAGFYQPVDMSPLAPGTIMWNSVKGGSTVPLKFKVFAGSVELKDTSAVKSLNAISGACSVGMDVPIDELSATGGTSLRYDTTGGQFIFNWQTPKKAGNCYMVTMTTQDGSSLSAYFRSK